MATFEEQLKKKIDEYYAYSPPAGLSAAGLEQVKVHVSHWFQNNYEIMRRKVPGLVPIEFLTTVLHFYNNICSGRIQDNFSNTLLVTSFIAGGPKFYHSVFDYCFDESKKNKEDCDRITLKVKKHRENVDKCLLILSDPAQNSEFNMAGLKVQYAGNKKRHLRKKTGKRKRTSRRLRKTRRNKYKK
jgi:hypothetical protein